MVDALQPVDGRLLENAVQPQQALGKVSDAHGCTAAVPQICDEGRTSMLTACGLFGKGACEVGHGLHAEWVPLKRG